MVKLSCFGDEIAGDIDTQLEVMCTERVGYIDLRTADAVPVLSLDDVHARDIKCKLDAAGVKVSAIGSPIGKIGVTDPFEPHLQAFHHAIELANLFDTRNIRVFSYGIPEGEEAVTYRDEVMRRMRAKADLAERAGLIILLENEKGLYGDSATRCRDVLDTVGSDSLRAVLDPANFVACGIRPFDDAYTSYGDRVDCLHVKDMVAAAGTVVPAGEGDGQLREILGALYDRDFSGMLCIEPHMQIAGARSGSTACGLFREATSALRNLMEEIGMEEEVYRQ